MPVSSSQAQLYDWPPFCPGRPVPSRRSLRLFHSSTGLGFQVTLCFLVLVFCFSVSESHGQPVDPPDPESSSGAASDVSDDPVSPRVESTETQALRDVSEAVHERLAHGASRASIKELSAVIADPNSDGDVRSYARTLLMEALHARKDYDAVLQLADEVIADRTRLDAESLPHASKVQECWAYLWRGRALRAKGLFEDALHSFRTCAASEAPEKPITFEAFVEVGLTYHDVQDDARALDAFTTARQFAETNELHHDLIVHAARAFAESALAQEDSELAAASLRSVIRDVALLTDLESGAARRLAQILPEETRIQWLRHVAYPYEYADPTAQLVPTRFGVPASIPNGNPVNFLHPRQKELALHLWGLSRYDEASEAFSAAASTAPSPLERAEMLQRSAQSLARLADFAGATLIMETVEEILLGVIVGPDAETARRAVDLLAVGYSNIGRARDQAFALRSLLQDPLIQSFPGRRCYIAMKLAERFWSLGRRDIALRYATEAHDGCVGAEYQPPFEHVCGELIVRIAYFHAYAGDALSAHQYLDELGEQGWTAQTTWTKWANRALKRHLPLIRDLLNEGEEPPVGQ